MVASSDRWYQIYKHIIGSGGKETLVGEVRGESKAEQRVESLNANLSKEEREAGWRYYRNQGSAKRKT
jgi:hypothetical protein